jgi:uncharacterized protein (TIGR00369 family)
MKMNAEELQAFLARVFPQAYGPGRPTRVEAVTKDGVSVRFTAGERHLRPGGTVSGPAMMALADATVYVAILAALGPVTLAVTTNLSINFLRKPEPGDLIAECKLLKLGKRLAVGEVGIRSASDAELVAHAVATYSIPPARGEGDGNGLPSE